MLATVLRTGQVLSLFGAGRPEWSLGEAAEALGLPPSTVLAESGSVRLVVDLCMSSSRFYTHASRVQAAVVSARRPVPPRRGQLAR